MPASAWRGGEDRSAVRRRGVGGNSFPAVVVGYPKEDGYALTRRVRAPGKEKGGGTASPALTAYARPEDRMQAMRAGFHLQVMKPVELTMMVATLAERNGD